MAGKKNPPPWNWADPAAEPKVPRGFSMLTDEQRAEISKKANAVRWGKK